MHYQKINEILAKGAKTEKMSQDDVQEIAAANAYLLNRIGNRPEWLDGFLESNRCKLIETICRATASGQGISSLQGYSEGYFNEIIQNADDLHYGDVLEITAKKNGENYCLDCQYDDRGFELSNIYAFLNREMSDKSDEKYQTGKFGVGIKSFFKFVNRLSIRSNVFFDFRIEKENNSSNISGTAQIVPEWNEKKTTLSIGYDNKSENEFNTGKLSGLIEYLNGYRDIDVLRCFLTGQDNEIVFDIRSLIFMKLNANDKKSISRLRFCGDSHRIDISCTEDTSIRRVYIDDDIWKIGVLCLELTEDEIIRYDKRFIVFSHNGISAAFPVSEFSSDRNRMYSTYYLKEDSNEQLLPIGMMIDSSYANLQRNDVGDNEEGINSVYKKIREYMKDLYGFMCSEEAADLPCAEAVSDVFHNIIARYLTVNRRSHRETPLYESYFDNRFLPKNAKGEKKAFVINHKKQEAYDSASYQEGDIAKELRECYYDHIEKKQAFDLQYLITQNDRIPGVQKVYELLSDTDNDISDENRRLASQITNYFASVAEFIVFSITHQRRYDKLYVSDAEIDVWLLQLKEETGKYFDARMFLKLIGRYRLNDAIAYDGSIRYMNLSFKDYLFNGALSYGNGILSQYQNQFYDEKYYGLKKELLQKRYQDLGNKKDPYRIRCIRPSGRSVTGWDGAYDFYEMIPPVNAPAKLTEPQLLLERMATDEKFDGMILTGSGLKLFESQARSMWRRDSRFKSFVIEEQQIIQLSCINDIELKSFADFINTVKYRCMLSEDLRKYIHIHCREETITTRDIIERVLPIMVETLEDDKKRSLLDEFSPSDIEIANIKENSNNEFPKGNSEFVYKVTGYRVHVYRFVSNTRRKLLAYFGDGKCAIKTESANKYREIARYASDDKNVYIFYDNFPNDIQQAVTNVLDEIRVTSKKLELLEGYIHNGNIAKTMDYISHRRNLAKVNRKLALDWADPGSGCLSSIYDTEILYHLLTARGSYDIFCPICADIPMEASDFEGSSKKHSRRIILMDNEDPLTNDAVPYIVTVGCSYCCQRLKNTLIRSEFDGKNIILYTQMVHGLHEKTKIRQEIEMSSINIEVMKNFKI